MSNIVIDIAAEFTGKSAFKKADSATKKLSDTAKGLAKTFGLAYGTAAVLGYAKASVKAAAADQKAQKQLALALQNVGLGRDAAGAERYVQKLQSEFGVVDDLLRPAYQQLAVATRDSAETQRLLGLSLDISASTGKDLSAVTAALSKAYLGNNAALSKLGVGISKADLKTKSFKKITDELAITFKGSAKTAAETFAGSMAKLGVASANVKEIIGTGIIDALTMLGKDHSIDELATNMERAALAVGDFARGLGVVFSTLDKMPGGFKFDVGMIPILGGYINALIAMGEKARRIAEVASGKNPIQSGTYLNKPLAGTVTATKKLTAAQTSALKLAKAKAIFDMQNIQIAAALKGKISDEDKIRLKLMQAIADENLTAIEKFTKALEEAQKKTKELQATLDLAKAGFGNPFLEAQNGADALYKMISQPPAGGLFGTGAQPMKFMYQMVALPPIGGVYGPGAQPMITSNGGTMGGNMVDVSGTGNNAGNAASTNVVNNNITVNGAVDAVGTANYLKQIIAQAANQVGSYQDWAQAYKGQSYAL